MNSRTPPLQPATATPTPTTASTTLRWTGAMPARTWTARTRAGACASTARWDGAARGRDGGVLGTRVRARHRGRGVVGAAPRGLSPRAGRAVGASLGSVAPYPPPQHHTTGINCERCLPGFFRAPDQPLDSPHACRREWGWPG